MKVELSLTVMAKLFNQGLLTPSEVNCLDEQSKADLKKLCIELCKPENCAQCDAREYCLKSNQLHNDLVAINPLNSNKVAFQLN